MTFSGQRTVHRDQQVKTQPSHKPVGTFPVLRPSVHADLRTTLYHVSLFRGWRLRSLPQLQASLCPPNPIFFFLFSDSSSSPFFLLAFVLLSSTPFLSFSSSLLSYSFLLSLSPSFPSSSSLLIILSCSFFLLIMIKTLYWLLAWR